jgi:hypothetical protein
MAETKKF